MSSVVLESLLSPDFGTEYVKTAMESLSDSHSDQNSTKNFHKFDTGETTWILACIGFTWLMIPGIGFFYNGMAPSKSALSIIMLCFWTCAIVSVQWYLIGYSLCLSNTGGPLIGNVDHLLLRNIGDSPAVGNDRVPASLVGILYCLFAAITPTIILGAVAERARFLPTLVFIFLWSTLVFDFLTYWAWNPNGWSTNMGSLDFGGGTPIHISTGVAALAFALLIGRRQDLREKPPHNMSHVILGTCFIWVGWLIANAGCGLTPSLRAVTVMITTNLSASVGGITWGLMDYRREKKVSPLSFCSGIICGLVTITPASGFVSPSSSIVFGFMGPFLGNLSMNIKRIAKIDDSFDVFAVHGIGGMVGNLLTGIFAQKSFPAVDMHLIEGGWLDGNYKQLGLQAIDILAGGSWSFVMTVIILFIIDKIPGLRLRASSEIENEGLDKAELGFSMYEHIEDIRSKVDSVAGVPGLEEDSVLIIKNRKDSEE